MFEYTIRRLLLMIPTGLGITFMVFFILQVAPDGPFERAVKQIKQANMGTGESGMSLSSDVTGDSSELTPELLEKLRKQYGLDKPIIVRYLIWLGFYPKEAKSKIILLNKSVAEIFDNVSFVSGSLNSSCSLSLTASINSSEAPTDILKLCICPSSVLHSMNSSMSG